MRYISLHFLLLFCTFCALCQKNRTASQIKDRNQVVIYDKLNLPASILVWYDEFDDEQLVKPFGSFNRPKFGSKRVISLDSPKLLVLPISYQIPYLVYPSDTLFFQNEDKSRMFIGNPTLKHKNNLQRTKELRFFEKVFDSIGPCYGQMSYSIPLGIQRVDSLLQYFKTKFDRRISFLEREYELKNVSKEFYKYATSYFKCKYYDDLFSGLANKRFSDSKNQNIAIADSLIVSLNKNEADIYPWYEAIKHYIELKINIETLTQNNFDSIFKRSIYPLDFKGKNFASFYLFKMLLNDNNELARSKRSLFEEYCLNNEYVNYVNSNTSFFKKPTEKSPEFVKETDIILDTLKNEKSLVKTLDSLKGKAIYIDFWASWCIPCLEELPYSIKLINDFKDKDIVFVFISLDAYADKWLKAAKANKISNKGIQFLLVDSKSNSFVREFNVGSIPRYMLINKKGEVVNSDAPRPSEDRLRQIIMKSIE